ncbi:MAG: zinc ribbon domain-containing protein [Mobilitalea sp.]
MSFCSNCGEQVTENNIYCKKCGIYLATVHSHRQSVEEESKFCLKCGAPVRSRYCGNCGNFVFRTRVKESTLLNTKQKLQDTVKNTRLSDVIGSELFNGNREIAKVKSNYKNLLKNGAIFAGIMFVLCFILSLGLAVISNNYIEKHFYDYALINKIKDLANSKLMTFTMLYGGNVKYEIGLTGAFTSKVGFLAPYSLLIFTVIFTLLADKIRYAVTKVKNDVYYIVTMALANSVVTTVVLLFLRKKVILSGDVLDSIFSVLPNQFNYYISDYLFGYGSDSIIIKSSFSFPGMLFSSFLMTLIVLGLGTLAKASIEKYKNIKSFVSTVSVILILTALVPTIVTAVRLISYDADVITVIMISFVLWGAFLIFMLTGNLPLIKYMMGSTTIQEVKLGLLKAHTNLYGNKESSDNPFNLILTVFFVLAIIIVLYFAIQLWKKQERTIKEVIKEALIGSFFISLITTLFTRIFALKMDVSVKLSKEYLSQTFIGSSIDNQSISLTFGAANSIKMFLSILIFIFILMILGYVICKFVPGLAGSIVAIKVPVAKAGFILLAIVLAIATIYTFKLGSGDYDALNIFQNTFNSFDFY